MPIADIGIEMFCVPGPLPNERNSKRHAASVAGIQAMTIEIKINGSSVAIANLVGRLIAGVAATCLQDQVDDLLRRNFTKIVLNMECVDLVDCAGIGQMVSCLCKAKRRGGGLRLVHVRRRLRELLALLRLESVFETFESEQAAVSSLAGIHTGATIPEQPPGTEKTVSCPSKNPVTGRQTSAGAWC